jgi:hypothetical protein
MMLAAGGYAIQQDQQKILGRIVHVASCYNRFGVPDRYLDHYPMVMRRYFGPCGVDLSFDTPDVSGPHKMLAEHHSFVQQGRVATDSGYG